jgi:chromate transporter
MLPGALLATILGAFYATYGSSPVTGDVLYAVKPIIIAVTAWSVIRLTEKAKPRPHRLALIGAAAVAYLLGVDELLVMLVLAALLLITHVAKTSKPFGGKSAYGMAAAVVAMMPSPDLSTLTAVFLKAGALLFGGGAVLLAVLHGELVVDRGWITEAQLLDAIAVGQVTPGPVLNVATFLGYLLGGPWAALLVTIAVLVPSFILMGAAGAVMRFIRRSPAARTALDGITLGAIAVLAGLTVTLARDALIDPLTIALAVAAALVLYRRPQSGLLLVTAGVAIGVLRLLFT